MAVAADAAREPGVGVGSVPSARAALIGVAAEMASGVGKAAKNADAERMGHGGLCSGGGEAVAGLRLRERAAWVLRSGGEEVRAAKGCHEERRRAGARRDCSNPAARLCIQRADDVT